MTNTRLPCDEARPTTARSSAVACEHTGSGASSRYLGYADATGLGFTPDISRSRVLGRVLKKESGYSYKLLQQLQELSRIEIPTVPLSGRRMLSPLAAIVLERARPRREAIATEMQKLRGELAPLRERLRKFDLAADFGTQEEIDRVDREWNAATMELAREFGQGEEAILLRRAIGFAEGASAIAADPLSIKAWVNTLLGLPLEQLRGLLARRPLVEIYRLYSALPGEGRLHKAVTGMFGDLGPP